MQEFSLTEFSNEDAFQALMNQPMTQEKTCHHGICDGSGYYDEDARDSDGNVMRGVGKATECLCLHEKKHPEYEED